MFLFSLSLAIIILHEYQELKYFNRKIIKDYSIYVRAMLNKIFSIRYLNYVQPVYKNYRPLFSSSIVAK